MRRRLGARGPSIALLVLASACTGGGAAPEDAGRPLDGGGSDAAAPFADGGAAPDAGAIGADGGLWFEDVTDAAGLGFDRIAADDYGSLPDRFSGGVCVIDADGHAPLDLFFALRPSTSGGSRLFVARGPFDYADETDARGLSDVGDAMGCLAFDADGDGDQDLLVTGVGSVRLFEQNGGHFTDVSARLGLSLDPRDVYTSAAAGDVDGDGDLDIVVAGFERYEPMPDTPPDACGGISCDVAPLAQTPIPDLLLIRQADGTYVDRAAALAPIMAQAEPCLVASIADFDGDGRQDVYLGNDLGASFFDHVLVHDASDLLVDASRELGLAYDRDGWGIDTMGFSTGDIDGDGVLDHVESDFENHATEVFLCGADGTCADRADDVGTTALSSTFRWGEALVDLDLDGDLDLVEATGQYWTDAEGVRFGAAMGELQRPNLLENDGSGHLVPVQPAEGDGLRIEHAARGIAVADLDDDGRPDIVLSPAHGRPALLRNVRAPRGHALRVRLIGRGANRQAAGAVVRVRAGDRTWVRQRTLGEGYLGSFDPRLLFGVPATGPVDVTVRWPDGTVTDVPGVALGGDVTIRQP